MVFHIGAHKTGTSVIQSVLAANRPVLRERGVAYLPRPLLDGFAKNSTDRDPHDGPLAVRLAELSTRPQTHTVIGSCENIIGPPFTRDAAALYPLAAARAKALHRVLEKYDDTTIVVTVRPQAEFLESYYLQTINQGGYDTFAQWLAARDLHRLAWRPVIDAVRAAFGEHAVRVIDFRLLRDGGPEAYVAEFMASAGPGSSIEIGPERDNASLSARGLEIALAINPLLVDKAEQAATRKFLQENFSNRSFPRPVLLTDEQRAEIDERYAADYQEVVALGAAATVAQEMAADG